jgi:hypothetical protein
MDPFRNGILASALGLRKLEIEGILLTQTVETSGDRKVWEWAYEALADCLLSQREQGWKGLGWWYVRRRRTVLEAKKKVRVRGSTRRERIVARAMRRRAEEGLSVGWGM